MKYGLSEEGVDACREAVVVEGWRCPSSWRQIMSRRLPILNHTLIWMMMTMTMSSPCKRDRWWKVLMTLCDLCGFITMAEDDVSLLGRNKESRGTNWGKNWSSKLRGSALGLSLSPSQPFRIPSKSFRIPQKITPKLFPQHHITEDQSRWCNPFGSQSGVKMSGRRFGDYQQRLKDYPP